jgi:hypothetical protein
VLDCDVLLTLAAVTVEGFGESRVGPGELVVQARYRSNRETAASPVSEGHSDGSSGLGREAALSTRMRVRPAAPRSARVTKCRSEKAPAPCIR